MPKKFAHKSKSWKSNQSSLRVKKKTKLAFIVLGLILLILIIGQFVNLAKTFNSPWKISTNTQRNNHWDKSFNINLVLKSQPLSILSYNGQLDKITLLEIPDETFMEVPHGFGSWQLRAIYDLGNGSKFGGPTLLKDSLSNFLGLFIDGYLEPNKNLSDKNGESLLENLRQNPLNIFEIGKFKSDLTLMELINLRFSVSQVRFDKIKVIDLSKLYILDEISLADGTKVKSADPIKIDSILNDFIEPEIQKEHLTIAIFNTTNHPLLAQKSARLVSNLGGNVIITTNSSNFLDQTVVLGDDSKTLEKLKQIFCIKCDKIQKDLLLDSSRAQINILLGEDFYQRF